MKKFLAMILALAIVLSLGAASFAAADAVTGTLADGTVISKPVSEVLLSAEAALAKDSALQAFFDSASTDPKLVSSGAIDLGGFFSEITEDTVAVPLPAPGTKVGDKITVTLSDGTSATMTCSEAGVVIASIQKDTGVVGFAVSATKMIPWVAPPQQPESGYPIIEEWTDPDGTYHYKETWENGYGEYTIKDNGDGTTTETSVWDFTDSKGFWTDTFEEGAKFPISYQEEEEEYDEDGNIISEYKGSGITDENGVFIQEIAEKEYEDGELTHERVNNIRTEQNGSYFSESNEKDYNKDGSVSREFQYIEGKEEDGYKWDQGHTINYDDEGRKEYEQTTGWNSEGGRTKDEMIVYDYETHRAYKTDWINDTECEIEIDDEGNFIGDWSSPRPLPM